MLSREEINWKWMREKWPVLLANASRIKSSPKRGAFAFHSRLCIKTLSLSWKKRLLHRMGYNPLDQYRKNAQLLADNGFSVPRPYGVIHTHDASILFLEYIEGMCLDDFLKTGRALLDQVQWNKCIRQLAEQVGKMHFIAYFDHCDLTAENILVKRNGEAFCFTFLDLDRVGHYPVQVPLKRRVKSLSQLYVSLEQEFSSKELLYFLKHYLKYAQKKEPLRPFFHKICLRTLKKRLRDSLPLQTLG